MRTLRTLKAGQKGDQELLTRYGPSLLCVRYRYDEDPTTAWPVGPVMRVWILQRDVAEGLDLLNPIVGGGG